MFLDEEGLGTLGVNLDLTVKFCDFETYLIYESVNFLCIWSPQNIEVGQFWIKHFWRERWGKNRYSNL